MAKKNKIQKNRPINEMMGEKEETITMQDVINQMDEKEEKAKQERKQASKNFKKKLQQALDRKDAQLAEDKRKEKYQRAVTKIIEQQDEER